VITARDAHQLQNLVDAHSTSALAVPLDVTNHDQIVAAMNAAVERFGVVDVLVNNAGHGYRATVGKQLRTRWTNYSRRTSSARST
jgi:NADP-dependent 3-hydroxy acid dehydrogenase YdfG